LPFLGELSLRPKRAQKEPQPAIRLQYSST
jgi:hypothetical protein